MAASDGKKVVEVTVRAEVDVDVTEEHVAEQLERALRPLATGMHAFDAVKIRTTDRTPGLGAASGYESRLWEKATCGND